MPKTEDLSRAFLDAQQLYASYGIAAAQDGMLTAEMLPLYQLLLGGDLLRMDVLGYAELAAYDAFAAALPNSVRGYDRHFRLAGLKIFLDGSPQGRTAWMLHPYQGEDEYCGYGVMKEDAVLTALALSAKKQVQLLAHCNGDAAVNQFLTCLAKAEAAHGNLRGLRPVIIHAQLITSEQLAWAARLSAIPSFFIAHVYHFGDTHIKNFGRNRAEGISPAKAALDLGLPFTFHQDVPVIPPNMLETVWCAAVRHTSGGETLGQPIPVLDALKAVTLNAAHQCFEENARGSLKVGKKADFVLLDHDPLAVDPERIREIKVLSLENGCADEPDSR